MTFKDYCHINDDIRSNTIVTIFQRGSSFKMVPIRGLAMDLLPTHGDCEVYYFNNNNEVFLSGQVNDRVIDKINEGR